MRVLVKLIFLIYVMRVASTFHSCPVPGCNRKYKTLSKFEKHLDEAHPLASMDQNSAVFTPEEKKYLLNQLQYYTTLLSKSLLKDDDPEFVAASCKLNPSKDLQRIVLEHWNFRTRAMASGLIPKAISDPKQLLTLIDEFQMFLNLGRPIRGGNFCPSMVIDLVWHAAMMDETEYAAICSRFFRSNKPLTHCLDENQGDEVRRNEQFRESFIQRFRRFPMTISDLILGEHENPNVFLVAKQLIEAEEERERMAEEARKEEERKHREKAQRDYETWRIQQQLNILSSSNTYSGNYRSAFDDGKC